MQSAQLQMQAASLVTEQSHNLKAGAGLPTPNFATPQEPQPSDANSAVVSANVDKNAATSNVEAVSPPEVKHPQPKMPPPSRPGDAAHRFINSQQAKASHINTHPARLDALIDAQANPSGMDKKAHTKSKKTAQALAD